MSNGSLAGAFSAWVVAYLLMGSYFVGAYVARRRQPEHLVFALLTLCLAVHTVGLAIHYASPTPETWRASHLVANGAAVAAIVFGVHFGILVGAPTSAARLLKPIYLTGAFFLLALLLRQWFRVDEAYVVTASIFGAHVDVVRAPPAWGALVFYTFATGATVSMPVLLGRAWLRGGQTFAAFAGAIVLLIAVLADIIATVGGGHWVHLTPHAYVLFAFGVAGSLIDRFRAVSHELEVRSAELERRTADLAASCEELTTTRAELLRKEQLAALGEMAAVVAHEIRNPVSIIHNALATLAKPAIKPDERETLLRVLQEESTRLNKIVTELLSYVRPLAVTPEVVNLGALLECALASASSAPGVTVVLEGGQDLEVVGDAVLLRRVFDNLVENALDAMPRGGSLRVRVGPETRGGRAVAVVLVADTGIGMSAEVVARARDPFFTTRAQGTGLGLAIVERILEAHRGELAIESEPARGTVVRIVLPVSALGDRLPAGDSKQGVIAVRTPTSHAAGAASP